MYVALTVLKLCVDYSKKPLRCMPRGLSLKVMLDSIRLRTTINHHTGHPSSASVSGSELGT